MGLSWTDRLEDVSAQEWDSVLVRSFRPSPFLSRHFLIPWAKTFAAGHPKRIYRWERNGETCGLLFLCLCESAKGWELLGGAPVSDSLAAVVVSGREAEFWSEFLPSSRDFLSLGPLLLPNLVDGSPSIACLPRLCAGLGLSFRLEEMDRDFPSFLALHRKSHLAKADFMDDRMEGFFREVAEGFLSAQRLRLAFLSGDGEDLASAFQIEWNGALLLYNSGFDPRYREASPGMVLLARCIEDGIRNGVREYDFLRGRERYKYDPGGREGSPPPVGGGCGGPPPGGEGRRRPAGRRPTGRFPGSSNRPGRCFGRQARSPARCRRSTGCRGWRPGGGGGGGACRAGGGRLVPPPAAEGRGEEGVRHSPRGVPLPARRPRRPREKHPRRGWGVSRAAGKGGPGVASARRRAR